MKITDVSAYIVRPTRPNDALPPEWHPYRLEHATSFIPLYSTLLQEPINFHGNVITLPKKPGLGIDLDVDAVKAAADEG